MKRPLVVIPSPGDSGFGRAGLANYGAALPELLRRLGFGTWDEIALAELGEDELEGRPLVIAAYAPEHLWTAAAVSALHAHPGPVVIEGPLPETAALQLFGMVLDGEVDDYDGQLFLSADGGSVFGGALAERLQTTALTEEPGRISSLASRIRVERSVLSRAELGDDFFGAVGIAYLDASAARLATPANFFFASRGVLSTAALLVRSATLLGDSDPAVATYAPWTFRATAGLINLVSAGLVEEEVSLDPVAVAAVIAGRGGPEPVEPDLTPFDVEPFMPELLEFLLPAAEYAALYRPDELDSYRELGRRLGAIVRRGAGDDVVWGALGLDGGVREVRGRMVQKLPPRRLAALCMCAELEGRPLPLAPLVEPGPELDKLELECLRVRDIARIARQRPGSEPVAAAALAALLERVEKLEPQEALFTFGPTAEAAAISGDEPARERVRELAASCLHAPTGMLANENGLYVDPWPGAAFLATRKILLGGVPGVPEELTLRWRRTVGLMQRWLPIGEGESAESQVETAVAGSDDRFPLVVGAENRVGTSFPLLTWLAAECAPPPASAGCTYEIAPAEGAWDTAVAVLEAACIAAGVPRRLAWPWPAAVGATIHHDLSRPATRQALESWLGPEAVARRSATYSISPGRPQSALRELLADLGHESALAGNADPAGAEKLEAAGQVGADEPFSGPAPWLAVEAAGLRYLALPWRHSAAHPTPLAVVDGKLGRARVLDLEGFDLDDESSAASAARRRDHLLLSPADADAADPALRDDAWWATLADCAERTRQVEEVEIRSEDGVLELTSGVDLPGLQLVLGVREGEAPCLLAGDTAAAELARGAAPGMYALDLAAGEPARIRWEKEGSAEPLEPTAVEPRHREATLLEIKAHLEEEGTLRPGEASLDEVLPAIGNGASVDRGREIAAFLRDAYGDSVAGGTLVHVGPGDLGVVLMAQGHMQALRVFEGDEEEVARLTGSVAELGLPGVEVQPFSTEIEVDEESADLVVLWDVLHEGNGLLERVAGGVRPGGVLFVRTPNPLAADGPGRGPSQHELMRRLVEAGFGEFRYAGAGGDGIPRTYALYPMAPSLYFAARRSGS